MALAYGKSNRISSKQNGISVTQASLPQITRECEGRQLLTRTDPEVLVFKGESSNLVEHQQLSVFFGFIFHLIKIIFLFTV